MTPSGGRRVAPASDERGGQANQTADWQRKPAARWDIHEGTTHVWFEMSAGNQEPSARLKPRLGQDERPDALD
jgi:hypothetical protein